MHVSEVMQQTLVFHMTATTWQIFFLECVAGLNDRKGCIFTNDMKLTKQNMKYFVFILSAMKYKSK